MANDKPNQKGRAEPSPETWTAQGLGHVDAVTRALVPAIHPATTYQRDPDGGYSSGRGYTRPHNPTYDEPEEMLRRLEGGSDCLLLSSGMAAATTVFQSLWPGDHVIAPRVMYWALRSWLVDFGIGWGLDVEFIDTGDLDALAAAVRPGKTQLVWLETPANPTWDIADIAGAAEIAHRAGARLAVDSTVATPVLTRPIEHGADLVVHSATKYLNGHSDVLAGAIVGASEDAFWNRIKACRRDGGAVLGPFEAWLLQRGMRTLFVRVRQSCESAMKIAQHFEDHAKVSVLYPGLPSHPDHALAGSQMQGGFTGMLSLRHRHGEAAAVETAARVETFKRATSLGGVESLIEHRASIEGPSTPVPRDLLRLSVGLENVDDLIADLEAALDHETGSNSVTSSAEPLQSKAPAALSAEERITQLLENQVHTLVADRGCELHLESFRGGVVTLRISGSPGASIPVRRNIENLFRHYLPEVESVLLGGMGDSEETLSTGSLQERVERVIRTRINPAIQGHDGSAEVVAVTDGIASIKLGGRCQGCAMASVTLRQGIEPLLREAIPELVAVTDVTDHQAGADPYFKTKKGASNRRILLLMPAHSYRAEDFLAAARQLGVAVTVGTNHQPVLSPTGDDANLTVEFDNLAASIARIEQHARKHPLVAIIGTDDDSLALAAQASAALGLPHNSATAIAVARDKLHFRQRLFASGLNSPAFEQANTPEQACFAAMRVGFPCVLKPRSLTASQGVVRVNDRQQCELAAQAIFALLEQRYPDAHPHRESLLVESYLDGRELVLEGLLCKGQLHVLAFLDKPDPLAGPYFEETLLVSPSREPGGLLQAITAEVANAARAMGLTTGPIHAEVRIIRDATDIERPVLLEIAPRSIGGHCSRSMRFAGGMTLESQIISLALDEDVGGQRLPEPEATGVMMIPIPARGILERVTGVAAARRVAGITDVLIEARPGDFLEQVPLTDRYLGFIFARGATPDAVETALRKACRELTFELQPQSRTLTDSVVDRLDPQAGSDSLNDAGTPAQECHLAALLAHMHQAG